MKIDIEVPHHEIQTVTLDSAIKLFDLTEGDVATLIDGKVVWVDFHGEKTALSKYEEDS